MHDVLVRLDRASLDQIKRDVRVHFPNVRHAHALEAVARGLGAGCYAALRHCAREYGAILWNGDDRDATAFLAERGAVSNDGSLGRLISGHAIDHEEQYGL